MALLCETPGHQESNFPDVRAMADDLPDEIELSKSALDVSNDIGSFIEQIKVEEYTYLVGPNIPSLLRTSFSFQRRQQRQMASERIKASMMSLSDTSGHLYTNGRWSDRSPGW